MEHLSYKNLAIASDHGGVDLKKSIISHINDLSKQKDSIFSDIILNDYGTNDTTKVDYPDYANKIAESIMEDEIDRGILICKTGIGMSMAANRYNQIRAALCCNAEMAKYARMHNNANILVIGSRIVDIKTALEMVELFLSTDFEGGYHIKRLNKIS